MFQIVGIVVVGLVVAVLLIAATRSNSFRIVRSTTIKAPPERIFPLITDFHRWTEWSPWEKLDPALNRIYSGAQSGRGAVYDWSGNRKAGQGRMEITEASPSSSITIKLDFLKPFEAHNTTEYTFEPRSGGTTVTWAMYGPNLFMGKVMSVFVNMDKLIGKDFDTGLANLKTIAEQ